MHDRRPGWPGWYLLFGLIPIVGIVLFAFKEWPVQRENVWLRSRLAERGMPLPPGPIPLMTGPDGVPVLAPPPVATYGYPGGPPPGYHPQPPQPPQPPQQPQQPQQPQPSRPPQPPPSPGESPEGERPA